MGDVWNHLPYDPILRIDLNVPHTNFKKQKNMKKIKITLKELNELKNEVLMQVYDSLLELSAKVVNISTPEEITLDIEGKKFTFSTSTITFEDKEGNKMSISMGIDNSTYKAVKALLDTDLSITIGVRISKRTNRKSLQLLSVE